MKNTLKLNELLLFLRDVCYILMVLKKQWSKKVTKDYGVLFSTLGKLNNWW